MNFTLSATNKNEFDRVRLRYGTLITHGSLGKSCLANFLFYRYYHGIWTMLIISFKTSHTRNTHLLNIKHLKI